MWIRVVVPRPAPKLNCIFCQRRVTQVNGKYILHHTIPIAISKVYGWLNSKEVPHRTKELLVKSRIPLCKSCHRKFHHIILPLTNLILSTDEDLSTPPTELINVLRGVNKKYGVRPRWSDRRATSGWAPSELETKDEVGIENE